MLSGLMMEVSVRWRQLDLEISADSQEFEQAVRAVVCAGQRLGGSSHFLGRAPD